MTTSRVCRNKLTKAEAPLAIFRLKPDNAEECCRSLHRLLLMLQRQPAAEAKTAAEAAKTAGDQAAADAATAKALAEEAKAAAAQAKADAIAEAATQVEALRNSMQAAIDNKLDVTVHEACCKSTRCSD